MATDNKYDRQLRLWGAQGQQALAETCVILLRATAAGTETLKNLVLPGVGSILVVDDAPQVSAADAATNFFLVRTDPAASTIIDDSNGDAAKPSTDLSRAEMATHYSGELNPDVQTAWLHVPDLVQADLDSITAAVPSISKRLLWIGSDLEPRLLSKVGQYCHQHGYSLILVAAYGLIGVVRLQTPLWPLMDPKPRDSAPDLRLTNPFPALVQMAQSIRWESLENHEHAHIPYPLILLRLAEQFKSAHNGQLPQTVEEKQAFQESIKKASRNFDMELNFQEAQRNAYLAYSVRELDIDHLQSLRDKCSRAAGSGSTGGGGGGACASMYQLLQALDQFMQKRSNNPLPPLQGTIPDMTASTQLYVQLQKIYKDQANLDWQEMRSMVPPSVSDAEVTLFCQNVSSMDVLQTRSLEDEYHGEIPEAISEELSMAMMEGDERPDQTPLLWYLGYRACQSFYVQHGRYPGELDDYQTDIDLLQDDLVNVVKHYRLHENEQIQETLLHKNRLYAEELSRYGQAEIHNIASVVGGVASQEAVKLITGQYVPINNTFVYNGIASIAGVYQF